MLFLIEANWLNSSRKWKMWLFGEESSLSEINVASRNACLITNTTTTKETASHKNREDGESVGSTEIFHKVTVRPTFTSDHVSTRFKLDGGRLVWTHYTLRFPILPSLGYFAEWLNYRLKKRQEHQVWLCLRQDEIKVRWIQKTKREHVTLHKKHFFNIVAHSMHANTWPHGSNLASAGTPHTRHLPSVSMATSDDEHAWGESVTREEAPFCAWDVFRDGLQTRNKIF